MPGSEFVRFLHSREWESDLGKRFVDHAVADATMPDVSSWDELEQHLRDHGAPTDNIEAARYVWSLFEDWKKAGA